MRRKFKQVPFTATYYLEQELKLVMGNLSLKEQFYMYIYWYGNGKYKRTSSGTSDEIDEKIMRLSVQ